MTTTRISLSLEPTIELWGKTDPEYVSYTLDWWTPQEDASWGNASVLTVDLSNPKVITMAKGLAPAFLRIGGSKADSIHYLMPLREHGDDASNQSSLTTTTTRKKQKNFRKLVSYCDKKPHRCLTADRWDEILHFAQKVEARVVFCINYLSHTRVQNKADRKDWDSTNARALLEYTARHAILKGNNDNNNTILYGLELGNELTHRGKATNLTRMRHAYNTLHSLVKDVWPNSWQRPKIIGPASTGERAMEPLAKVLLSGNVGAEQQVDASSSNSTSVPSSSVLDIFSYHQYHAPGGSPDLPERAQEPEFFSHPGHFYFQASTVHRYFSSNDDGFSKKSIPLWIGEGAMAYNSGRLQVTNSFQSSLWYANLLGTLARTLPLPHSVYCRQSLLGGHYELIDHETLEPHPDYWIAYLWTHLVGTRSVGPLTSSSSELSWHPQEHQIKRLTTWGCCASHPLETTLRAHAFCAKPGGRNEAGDVVVVLVHLDGNHTYSIDWTNVTSRSDFVMTADRDSSDHPLTAQRVLLNGRRTLQLTVSGELPHFWGTTLLTPASEPLIVPPYSVTFTILHGIDAPPCTNTSEPTGSQVLEQKFAGPPKLSDPRIMGDFATNQSKNGPPNWIFVTQYTSQIFGLILLLALVIRRNSKKGMS